MCVCEKYGSLLLDVSVSKQQMLALSSGEAEFYSIIKGSAMGIQTRQVLEAVLRHPVSLEILSDSSAARGICQRQGSGRVRHLSAKDLWVQEFFRTGQGGLKKVGTKFNWADLGTKIHPKARLEELLEMMPLRRREGSSLERSREASVAVFLLLASLATQSAAARRPRDN